MGIAQSMEDNMKTNSQKMFNFQREIALKQRQIQLATQFAIGKDRFMFYSCFFFTLTPFLIYAKHKTGNKAYVAPIFPLSILYAYQWDMYSGNKMNRIRVEAARLIKEEGDKFYPAENNMIWSMEEYKRIVDQNKDKE